MARVEKGGFTARKDGPFVTFTIVMRLPHHDRERPRGPPAGMILVQPDGRHAPRRDKRRFGYGRR